MKETLEKHFHRKPTAKHFVTGIFAHAKSKTYANKVLSQVHNFSQTTYFTNLKFKLP